MAVLTIFFLCELLMGQHRLQCMSLASLSSLV